MQEFLPIAAIVAICLFIAKETFEFVRRILERRRKVRAAKQLLCREVSHNFRVLNYLFGCIDRAGREFVFSDEKNVIVTKQSGTVNHEIQADDGTVSGSPLPEIRTADLTRLLPIIAEFDAKLFKAIRDGYDHVDEVDHLRTQFIDLISQAPDRMWLESFLSYASKRHQDLDAGIRQLYRTLSGKELPNKSLRKYKEPV